MKTYTLPQDLLQAIVSNLNQQPAGQVRGVLNAIEQTCIEQDKAETEQAKAQERTAMLAEIAAATAAAQAESEVVDV